MKIPFNSISITGKESEYIQNAIENLDKNYYTQKCVYWLKNYTSVEEVLMTSSATSALELAVRSIADNNPCEIILPSFAFPSTANAVLLAGAQPIFCDIDKDTLCLDIKDFESKITSRTKAVIILSYGGICPDIENLIKVARKHNLIVIEDSAHAFLSSYKDKPLGTWGDFGVYSFHSTKNIVCGNGGALLINTSDKNIIDKIQKFYHYGTNKVEFQSGKVSAYNWQSIGLNPQSSELSMAFLLAQLESSEQLTLKRKESFMSYYNLFSQNTFSEQIDSYSKIYPDHQSNYHTFYIILKNKALRDYVIQQLKMYHIDAYFHFMPLHLSPMGEELGYNFSDFPTTEKICEGLLRLPLYNNMTKQECQFVIQSIKKVLEALNI